MQGGAKSSIFRIKKFILCDKKNMVQQNGGKIQWGLKNKDFGIRKVTPIYCKRFFQRLW